MITVRKRLGLRSAKSPKMLRSRPIGGEQATLNRQLRAVFLSKKAVQMIKSDCGSHFFIDSLKPNEYNPLN